ncbi:hypothetical protein jhhlp_006193 [Lomentospora prolificans]|uniref:Phosphatidylinositol-specific phospholipase C X domain-containing protein n=1 Tax=Lomentospora prolificans TaxID=41688 RepID=A0A2N3N581_9PEZI|nr:hypothetical protein jhhlp_006193 [Lomentospora prolificans]
MVSISISRLTRLCLLGLTFSHNALVLSQGISSSSTTTVAAATTKTNGADALKAEESKTTSKDVTILVGTKTIPNDTPTGAYATYTGKITLPADNSTIDATVTFTGSVSTTFASNISATDTGAQPKNTQPCNNYVEFCERKYSNITVVGCHNSPFVRKGSSAANQQLDVVHQLNDGVRFLQAQIQWPTDGSNVPHFCHSSCDMLDAGPITDWLTTVREWVDNHPYDVVTILLGNGNYSKPDLYAPHIEASGILKYAYRPPFVPMALDDWPTLSEMILKGKRVVMFLDYEANPTEFPWLLDEFSQMWETPFDPIDNTFPCTVQRPPDLAADAAKDRLYLLNHNLNAEFNLFGASILVPAVSLLNVTNGENGEGSLGNSTAGCVNSWGRPPNILNVDYYNFGTPEGSVFKVAARFNNVTYNGSCCGKVVSEGAGVTAPALVALCMAVAFSVLMSS